MFPKHSVAGSVEHKDYGAVGQVNLGRAHAHRIPSALPVF